MKKKILYILIASVFMFTGLSISLSIHQAFADEFNDTTLNSSWQVINNYGSRYSLTDNPGYLRYYLEGSTLRPDGWKTGISNPWNPSLNLILPFGGDNWTLNTKVTYNLHSFVGSNKSSQGAQGQSLFVAFGGGNDFLEIYRNVDAGIWPPSNAEQLVFDIYGGHQAASLLASDDIIQDDGWARYTYWYEIARNGQNLTVNYSYDGTNFTTGFTGTLPDSIGSTQKFVIGANVWTTAAGGQSYADWDYVRINVVPEPISSVLFVTGGTILAGRRLLRRKV